MSNDKPTGFNSHDGSEFGTEMKSPLDEEIIHEVTENARSLSPDDDRVVVEEHLDGLVAENRLDFLDSRAVVSSLLFMADHNGSWYTPAEKRAEDLPSLLEVSLEYRPVTIEGVGDAYVSFDVKADPQTREIRYVGIHLSPTAGAKRQLVNEGRIAL